MKKIISLTLVALIILSFSAVASAASINITITNNSITKISSTQLRLYSYTRCDAIATRIRHSQSLQVYQNGSWTAYNVYSGDAYNVMYYVGYTYANVEAGRTYRLVTMHYAYDGTTIVDSAVTFSASITT